MTQTPDMPASLPALVAQRAAEHPDRIILRRKARGIWQSVTWKMVAEEIRSIAAGLHALGIGRGDTVAIIAETRPETVYADIAIQACGAASLIFAGDTEAPQVEHALRSTGSRAVFVEDEQQLDKILTVRAACPALSQVVIFDMKGLREFRDPQCSSLIRFMASESSFDWMQAARDVTADQPAAMLLPDGKVLMQRDVIGMLGTARNRLGLRPSDERLALLGMSDPIERCWGLYAALDCGCISNYLESLDTAVENLQELQPTVLGADALMWSHLHARTMHAAGEATAVQRHLYNWAIRTAHRGGSTAKVADAVVLRAVRRELGLRRLRLAYTGGAIVPTPTLDWARSLGIRIQRIDTADAPAPSHERPYDPVLQKAPA